MKRLCLILLAIALIGILIFGGCSKSTTTPTPTPTPAPTPAPAPQKVLKIGTTQDLSTLAGLETKNWYDLFAKLINDQGGWKIGSDTYKVEMVIYDDSSDAVKQKSNLEKLVLQDGCKYVLGGIFGVAGSASVDITVTEPNKVIDISGDVSDASADPAVKYFYAAGGTYFGRGLMYRIYTDMLNEGVKSYVSVKTDNQMGHIGDAMCNQTWKLVGGDKIKFLGTIFYDPSTTDYAPIATKIKNLNPDCIDGNYGIAAASFYSALKDVGYKGIILPSSIGSDDVANYVTKVGKDFIEGGECFFVDPRGLQKDPGMVALMDAYVKQYGDFKSTAMLMLAPWFVLKDAIEHTQSVDVETVKKYLDNSNHAVMTLTTYVQLFARPDLNNYRTVCGTPPDLLGVIHDGKLTAVAGVGPETHYLSSVLSYGHVDIYKKYWDQYGYPKFPSDQQSVIHFSDLGITGHD